MIKGVNMNLDGLITKGIGGFYYVETSEGVFECKAKGKFRKQKLIPLAGDRVKISVNKDAENTIDEIYERKNALVRPPVANIDILVIVVSACEPAPNALIIDKMTVLCEKNNIEPVIVFTKNDLASAQRYIEIYKKTPYKVFTVSYGNDDDIKALKAYFSSKLVAFTGNSGVGKSTLLNALCPSLNLATANISEKLGRGRHTTRHAEIFKVDDGRIIDTAGFSAVDFSQFSLIKKEDLQYLFPEFQEYICSCRFTGCAHICDKGCKILEEVQNGNISKSRHDSYVSLYNDAKNIKEWQL